MKTDKNFNLKKSVKRVMGSIKDKAARDIYKREMIQAQATFEVNQKNRSTAKVEKE